eukprot:CAMPEP_0202914172 /NCGR_PEP_ID=MMETSP1392-20130828/62431_1 /ASSEMBLY_ACC=CAM_ASM_000868 /TAXON_ID=225041 /ORGANISM="Chlamydomonas chlamydogama, Strain SAG 11-48b" /LENGTH=116 /DNA_ID=CAMNT_0049605717 /DNA_START=73 /DNA_END=420 /DNA_ORIENTATION=+
MSRNAPDPFGEHVSVMKALYQEYQKKDEFDSMTYIDALLQEIQQMCSQREAAVKASIQELSKRVSEAEVLATYPEPDGFHDRRVSAIQKDMQDVQQGIDQLQNTIRGLEDQKHMFM